MQCSVDLCALYDGEHSEYMNGAIWENFLAIIRQEAGSRVVDTWFKAVSLRCWDPTTKTVYLEAPNRFVRDWVQTHYADLVRLHIERLLNVASLIVVFEIDHKENKSPLKRDTAVPSISGPPVTQKKRNSIKLVSKTEWDYLNISYKFDAFVVGPSNSLAYAASKAVAEKPGFVYNPLFLYGSSGLGKTHLLHAIGHEIKKRHSKINILYQTADRFVGEFIYSIRFDKIHRFKAKYKSIDVLLIDDIQFISNKEQTQEAFFHIFNSLYNSQKQIVFSSDSIPQKINGLADRLRSRLAWGLVADVHIPSLETKVAIVKRKAESSNEILDDEVAHFIASHMVTNIRELEGALIRVIAFASLMHCSINLELAKRVLGQGEQYTKPHSISFDTVIKCLKKKFNYSLDDLRSKNRNKDISFARHVTMFLMKEVTDRSLREIGNYLGGRDHSTVMHALQRIRKDIDRNRELGARLSAMKQEIMRMQ